MSKKINNILLSTFPVVALLAHSMYNDFNKNSENLLDKYNPLFAVWKIILLGCLIAFCLYFLRRNREYDKKSTIVGMGYIIIFLLPKILCAGEAEVCENFYVGRWAWYVGVIFLGLYGFMFFKNRKKEVKTEKLENQGKSTRYKTEN